MKIAYDHLIFTAQQYGGISRYYTILAEELLKKNQDVGVFSGVHRNHYLQTLPSDIVRGFKLEKYPPNFDRIFHALNFLTSQVKIKLWQPDIVHETYYSSLPVISTNTVRVTSAYDMIHELFSDQFSNRDKTTDRKASAFSRVDHILSISHSTKNDLVDIFGIEESKVSVVHLGVDFSAFESFEKSDKGLLDKPYLLYVGSRGGYKNFTGFIKSVASSNQLMKHFDVLAFGGGSFNADEMSLLKKLGFRDSQVRQVGGNDDLLANLYHNAEAFVYPSLYEGFGLPPLEAMAAGCPVVSSNTSSMPEVVRNAGEYFNPHDIDDMREAIERVVSTQDLRQMLIQSGYENIKDFSWQQCASKTLDIYKKLAGKL